MPQSHLPPLPDRDAVVVLVGGRAPALVRGTPWAEARSVVLGPGDLDEVHDRLSRLDRLDLVIDVRPSPTKRFRLWRSAFLYLDEGGYWLTTHDAEQAKDQDPLARVLDKISERRSAVARRDASWHELAHAVGHVDARDSYLSITKRHKHLLKVRDEPAMRLLREREPGLAVTEVAAMPGGTLNAKGRTHHYGIDTDHDIAAEHGLPEALPYPAAIARRYFGAVMLSHAHSVHGRSLLPESFRWHLAQTRQKPGLIDGGPHFARLKPQRDESSLLRGSYYNLDYSNPGHYGHLMTEAVSRLWAWPAAKEADPALRILLRASRIRKKQIHHRPETYLLPAFGIDPEDITWFDDTVHVESLVGATPLWHNAVPHYAHPRIRQTWATLRDGLSTGTRSGPERIFVTRREGNRLCRNFEEVERLFVDLGFSIVHPVGMTISEQATLFAGARVVAGFGGTGMFNLVFAERLEAMIVLNHTSYDARNEHLFAAVLNADIHLFWNQPEIREASASAPNQAFQSPWVFDTARHSGDVRAVVRGLR